MSVLAIMGLHMTMSATTIAHSVGTLKVCVTQPHFFSTGTELYAWLSRVCGTI